ncbi:MAG: sulfotransferase [Cyanobacteria bacterium]|nr:sulfotransferase [Cyanobacteriota bacterium]MDA0865078.1 sulfotransferase [Cyanobacteriota bacterium]
MALPNFLVIGAAKCGTTALDRYLREHPQIYMSPVKELNFFALEGINCEIFKGDFSGDEHSPNLINKLCDYQRFFDNVSDEIAIGESSPLYLLHPSTPQNIQRYIPDAKLIAILRDPVERAYSDFLFNVGRGTEDINNFSEALAAESHRINENYWFRWHYKERGFYYIQIQRYFKLFSRTQIKVYLHEDLKANSLATLQDIFRFLGVDDTFMPNLSQKHNVTYVPQNRLIDRILDPHQKTSYRLRKFLPLPFRKTIKNRVKSLNRKPIPTLSPQIRQQLVKEYQEDILQLQDLIQKDLSNWLKI